MWRYCRLMAIATTRPIGSECHLVAELRTSACPLRTFITDVNDALRCTCHAPASPDTTPPVTRNRLDWRYWGGARSSRFRVTSKDEVKVPLSTSLLSLSSLSASEFASVDSLQRQGGSRVGQRGLRPQVQVRGLPPPTPSSSQTKFLLSVIGHLELKFGDYMLVLCQKLHIWTYDW